MNRDTTRAMTAGLFLIAATVSFVPDRMAVTADPIIINNPDGTSDAVWNFTDPSDYTLSNTEIVGSNVTLLRQPSFWWNSTTLPDFSGADSITNVTVTRWPGEVALSESTGSSSLLTIQPGIEGIDTFLNWNSRATNYGTSPMIILNGQAHAILHFDISSIPAKVVIDHAELGMYQLAGEGNDVIGRVHHLTAPWNETQANWDYRLTGVLWTNGGGDYALRRMDMNAVDNTLGWKSWDVTQLIDLWYRGLLVNHGLIIEGPNPGPNCDKTFYSSEYSVNPALRPRISVWYRAVGVAGEYISKLGGPGTMAVWKSLSWNPAVRERLSDDFEGSSLDSKWTWANSPAAYDVGTTTPGSLHVLSGVGVDFSGETFTGAFLSQDLVGDFTAKMKYSVNPSVEGHESGLMVLADTRNWFAIGQVFTAGIGNWRVQATDDGVTTSRANVVSGNPIPAWIQVQRAGNTFTLSTSGNGISWAVRDSYAPSFTYPSKVSIGIYVDDGLSGVALPVDVDFMRFMLPDDAKVGVQTRIGNSNPADSTWSSWSSPYLDPSSSTMSGASRYVQYRLAFSTATPGHVPAIRDVNISWFFYTLTGAVETNDLIPVRFSAWGDFTVLESLNGQSISYQYSLDSGANWVSITPHTDMRSVGIATGRIRFRATLSTTSVLVSPSLSEMRLTYTQGIDHFYVGTPPTAIAGADFSVSVTAKDSLNATLAAWNGTVVLDSRLQDGMMPGGGILGTTSLMIPDGGTATLNTEIYTKAETIRIHVAWGIIEGLSESIVVSPAAVDRVAITPDDVTILAFASQVFTAQAYDQFNNIVSGAGYVWVVNGGVGSLNSSSGKIVLFTSNPPAASGTLQVTFDTVFAVAQISVTLGIPPWIIITAPVPGEALTGVVQIVYANSLDAVSVQFTYNGGTGWVTIGVTASLTGVYYWDTSGLDFVNGVLAATVTNALTATNMTVVSPIEVDNTPPAITLRRVTDNQMGNGTLTIFYTTVPDVASVDLSYFDGSWHTIGTDMTIDGYYLWIPGAPINGVTLRAVAVDHVGLTGWAALQGVGSCMVGTMPPSIAPIPDLQVRVASSYFVNLTFYVSDPDTPLSALSIWASDPLNVVVRPGSFPSLDVTYGAAGEYLVTLWVSDGTDTAWALIRIVASLQNPPLLIASLPMVVFDEDTIDLDGFGTPATTFFNDPDGDPLSFSLLDASNVHSRVNSDDTIDFWATSHWSGSERLRLRAMDPNGGFAEGAFTVIVRDVNHPPILVTPFPSVSFDENEVAFDVFGGDAANHFNDLDGDPLAISIHGNVNVTAIVDSNGIVDMWGATNWCGSETLLLRATDPWGAFAEGVFVVTVLPVNHPPILLSALPVVMFNEDSVALDVFNGPVSSHFYDMDGDSLTFTVTGGVNVFYRLNAGDVIDMWATTHWHGQENMVLRATDSNGSFVDAPFIVLVLHTNHAPILEISFPAASFFENSVGLDVFGGDVASHFADVDGDPLVITIMGGINVDNRLNLNGTLDLWAPMYWNGAETLVIRATDTSGLFAEGTSLVTVLSVEQPPAMAPIPDLRLEEGARFVLDSAPYISDVDTPISLIVVTTDSEYVAVNGTVLTLAYPANQAETVFTISVFDGVWTTSQRVRVFFIQPWWKDTSVITILPLMALLGLLLGALVTSRRERWRPAKAFLLGKQRQLVREIAFDQGCQVTFDEVSQAGATDAIEKSVKVGLQYHARMVAGKALSMVIVARGSISTKQAEYAKEMLLNVYCESEESVKLRLWAETSDIEAKQGILRARSRELDGAFDAAAVAKARVAEETAALKSQQDSFLMQKARLKEQETELASEMEKFKEAQAKFETMRKEFEEIAIRFEKESSRRMSTLKGEDKAPEVEQQPMTKRRNQKKRVKQTVG